MDVSQKYPKRLKELAHFTTKEFVEMGFPDDLANYFAFIVTELVRKKWGGSQLYIPSGKKVHIAVRNSEIFKRFDGKNYLELSQEVGLTERQIRYIIEENQGNK